MIGVITMLIGTVATPAQAAAGDLNPLFGTLGVKTLDYSSANDYGQSLAITKSGKILLAGSINGGAEDVAVARLATDGQLDMTFGAASGFAVADVGTSAGYVNSVGVQRDGKIVIAGSANDGGLDKLMVARFTKGGGLDPTFGNGGVFKRGLSGDAEANDLVIQRDGRIVVTGDSESGGDSIIVALRLRADGTTDPTWRNKVIYKHPGSTRAEAFSLITRRGGGVLLGGFAAMPSEEMTFLQLAANGQIDASFGTNGWTDVTYDSGTRAKDLAKGPGHTVVATGYRDNGTDQDFAWVRIHANGSLDNSFNNDGRQHYDLNFNEQLWASVVDPSSGVITSAGAADNLGNNEFSIVRLLPNGDLDTSWDGDGLVQTGLGSSSSEAVAIVRTGNTVTVAGDAWVFTDFDFAIAQYFTS